MLPRLHWAVSLLIFSAGISIGGLLKQVGSWVPVVVALALILFAVVVLRRAGKLPLG